MSPEATCCKCGRRHVFHEVEVNGLLDGKKIYCTDCTLDRGYDVFLGEVLGGQHKQLIELLKERLAEEEC